MKSFDILKSLAQHKYTAYELIPTTDLREYEVHCGELKPNKWYIFCENPQLGHCDACGKMRRGGKMFYAYVINE